MKVILISGKAEAGKSATGDILANFMSLFGYKYVFLPYGNYVKTTAKELWGWDGKKDEAGRALLQWWGTDCVRKKDPLFWVNTVLRLAKVLPDNIDYAIIPDARFQNEITSWNGTDFEIATIRVERPGHISALTEEQLKHISETNLDNWKFDFVLSAKNMAELEQEVKKNFAEIIKPGQHLPSEMKGINNLYGGSGPFGDWKPDTKYIGD